MFIHVLGRLLPLICILWYSLGGVWRWVVLLCSKRNNLTFYLWHTFYYHLWRSFTLCPLISLAYCGQSCSIYVPYFIPITMAQVPCRYHVRFMSYDAFTYDASFAYSRRLFQVIIRYCQSVWHHFWCPFHSNYHHTKVSRPMDLFLNLWCGLSNGGEPHRIWPILWQR